MYFLRKIDAERRRGRGRVNQMQQPYYRLFPYNFWDSADDNIFKHDYGFLGLKFQKRASSGPKTNLTSGPDKACF